MNKGRSFPTDFVWGTATSSYQIEGAHNVDGRGESIWDRFSHTPGKIFDGTTGDVACDHYHRYPEDIKILQQLGVSAYRFSIAWPRVFPQGRGPINPLGLDFYSRLVDGLLEAGITPYPTLYHWDLPQALQDAGGWPQRATAEAFANYADVVTAALGDRVKHWTTFNEPWVSATHGYQNGEHAPGHTDIDEMLAASHHLLLAHGLALPPIRRNVPNGQVGIVLNLEPKMPASRSVADRQAAYIEDGTQNRWYLDPLAGRGYPLDIISHYNRPVDFIRPGDEDLIAQPIDYLGINYYSRAVIRGAAADNLPAETVRTNRENSMGWEIYPPGLYDLLCRVHFDYHFPALYITENGAAFKDTVAADGGVHDDQRVAFLQEHVAEMARAIAAGVPLKGYFAWSLMDNFEWAYGLSERFGIVYVDFETQQRIIKDSGLLYREIIAANKQ